MSGGSLTVAGATTNDGTILFDGQSGTATFADLDGAGAVIAVGGVNAVFNHLRQTSLNLDGETVFTTRVNGGPSGVSRVNALDMGTISPTTFWNLNDNDLIVDYPSGGPSPASDIREMLIAGHNGGTWDGPGLSSATAAADHTKSLGYADNSTLNQSTFSGQSVDPTSVLVKYTYYGDADLDGDADGVDIGNWALNFTGELGGGPSATRGWTQGDWDYDGDVDGVDAGLWATAFTGELGGAGLVVHIDAPLSRQAAEVLAWLGVTVVPEPGSVVMLGAITACSLGRPRTRRKSVRTN
jgi:hypothetical protein